MSGAASDNSIGERMYGWARDLFPICRSLTGEGTRATLRYLQGILPELVIHEVPSGTQAFDWVVPDEWNIRDAYVEDESGRRVIDFRASNLHVVHYSVPVDTRLTFAELDAHLHSLPEQPDAIPYVTSYYERRWGFCLAERVRRELARDPARRYRVRIDATLAPGSLSYGEWVLPGETAEEVLLSTYICHPSMANNELSGPCVAAALAERLRGGAENGAHRRLRYTYRVLFLVETIGALVWLSRHLEEVRPRLRAGFVLSCLGDTRAWSHIASRYGDTLADKVARHALRFQAGEYKGYSFLERGSDERQYCSPGVDLPVCGLSRSKYGEYPEYHTSLDDLSLISPAGLAGSLELLERCVALIEANRRWVVQVRGEPQLGRRGLYPTLSTRESGRSVRTMMNFLAYADGRNDLIDIAERIGADARDLAPIAARLHEAGLIREG